MYVRWFDGNLNACVGFIGLYKVDNIKSETVASTKGVLIRTLVPPYNARGIKTR